ncbi:hypothetical protein WBQ88_05440 [Sphingopyxis sp. CCNWLW253]|uniref:hypothetical protein n=1 Tax=unclassified Sphingopyxis TaxID=2614943 RepID=UPI003012E998
MPKKKWNDLARSHAVYPVYSAGPVSSSAPKKFDKAGLTLPSPYGLLLEWLGKNLSGDWAATKTKIVASVRITDPQDAAQLTQRFPALGTSIKTAMSPHTQQIRYADADYAALATELGYAV